MSNNDVVVLLRAVADEYESKTASVYVPREMADVISNNPLCGEWVHVSTDKLLRYIAAVLEQ